METLLFCFIGVVIGICLHVSNNTWENRRARRQNDQTLARWRNESKEGEKR